MIRAITFIFISLALAT